MRIDIDEFSEKIRNDILNDPLKAKWEGSDTSWWLAKLASEVNAISRALNDNKLMNVEDMAVSAASYAFIIMNLQDKGVKQTRKYNRK